jgi:hypothetical protein
MKARFPLLIVTALLLVATVASTTPAPAVAPAANAALVPGATATAGEPLACGARSSLLGSSGLTPAPLFASATCGTCSRAPCVGASYGQFCGRMNGQNGYCLSPLGDNCPEGVTFKCQCWYGPLP